MTFLKHYRNLVIRRLEKTHIYSQFEKQMSQFTKFNQKKQNVGQYMGYFFLA
jgi:hypothetical protein